MKIVKDVRASGRLISTMGSVQDTVLPPALKPRSNVTSVVNRLIEPR